MKEIKIPRIHICLSSPAMCFFWLAFMYRVIPVYFLPTWSFTADGLLVTIRPF